MELIERYRRIFELAKPYLNTRHNLVHTQTSCRFASELLKEEGGDPDVVIPAILLHDVGWTEVAEDIQLKAFGPGPIDEGIRRIHEVEGVRLARAILSQVGWDSELTDEILAIIDGHDSRLEAASINDKIVKDADKLFRFSDQGFAIDCERFNLDPLMWADSLHSLVDRWLFTETARRLARRELEKKPFIASSHNP